jgi:hypothetical protein
MRISHDNHNPNILVVVVRVVISELEDGMSEFETGYTNPRCEIWRRAKPERERWEPTAKEISDRVIETLQDDSRVNDYE